MGRTVCSLHAAYALSVLKNKFPFGHTEHNLWSCLNFLSVILYMHVLQTMYWFSQYRDAKCYFFCSIDTVFWWQVLQDIEKILFFQLNKVHMCQLHNSDILFFIQNTFLIKILQTFCKVGMPAVLFVAQKWNNFVQHYIRNRVRKTGHEFMYHVKTEIANVMTA